VEFDHSKLRGKIKEHFSTQQAFAKAMGFTEASLSAKLNGHTEFTRKEIDTACALLGISTGDDIRAHFFTCGVRKSEPTSQKG